MMNQSNIRFTGPLIVLFIVMWCTSSVLAQTRQSGAHLRKAPGSTSLTNPREDRGKIPEFHTHESAVELERSLPLRIPLSPYFYASEDLNGYVDIWRNVSYVQTEYDTDSIPWIYENLHHFVDDWTSETFHVRSEKREGLKPLSRNWEVTANGYEVMHMRYDYVSDEIMWKREEYYVLDPNDANEDGTPRHHMIGVIVHYPAEDAADLEQEVLDAMNHAVIN